MSIKSVYTMGPDALRIACRKAANDKNPSSKYWDALWYRASVVAPQLSVSETSIIIDSMRVFPKFKSPLLAEYLLKNLGSNGSILDYSMLLRNASLLDLEPSNRQKLFGLLEKKLNTFKGILSWTDIERIVTCCAEIDSLQPTLSRIVSDKLAVKSLKSDPKIFVNLFCWAAKNYEPFYEDEIFSKLFSICVSLSPKFSTIDVVAFAKAQTDAQAAPVVSRQISRLSVEFKPDQITSLIILHHPTRFPINIEPLVAEFRYKIRDFSPINCVKIWQHLSNIRGFDEPSISSVVIARLLKYDTNTTLRDPRDLELLVKLVNQSTDSRAAQLLAQLAPNLRNKTDLPQ